MIKYKDTKYGLNQSLLKEFLEYNPDTGFFIWKISKGNLKKGSVAGFLNNQNGYIIIRIDNHSYRAHRLAFLYMTGQWPKDQIDHINCIRNDNRWINLRESSSGQNLANTKLSLKNKSGYKGVFFVSRNKKYRASIKVKNKTKHLGLFDNPEEASKIYKEAAIKYFGEYARFK